MIWGVYLAKLLDPPPARGTYTVSGQTKYAEIMRTNAAKCGDYAETMCSFLEANWRRKKSDRREEWIKSITNAFDWEKHNLKNASIYVLEGLNIFC